MMTRKTSIALGLTCTAALTFGCDSNDEPDGPIAFAVVAPLSGPNAGIGEEVRNTIELAMDDTDGTVGGRELQFVYVDSESDAAAAKKSYEETITDPEHNIVAGFFNWHSDVALELIDVAADEELAHITALGASGEINEKVAADPKRYAGWSKGWPTPVKLSANYVTAIEEAITSGSLEVTDKTFAVYGETTSWGENFGAGIKEQLEAAGWTLVAEEAVAQDASDYSEAVDRIRASEARIVVGTIVGVGAYTFVSQTRAAFADGTQPLIVADGLGWNADWFQVLGDDSDGVVDQIPQFATQEAQDYASAYTAQYGAPPSPSAGGLTFDYFRFALKVLETANDDLGSITRASVLETHADKVLTGELDFTDGVLMSRYVWDSDSKPDPVIGGDAFTFPVLQYSAGESRVVWPDVLRSGTAQLE